VHCRKAALSEKVFFFFLGGGATVVSARRTATVEVGVGASVAIVASATF
jgi:hypothetical protein